MKRLMAGLLSMALCILPLAASAQVFDAGMGLFRSLGLTTEQKTQIQTIRQTQQSTLTTDMTNLKTSRSNLTTYLKGGGSDPTQIATLTNAIGSAVAVLATAKANIFVSEYGVLTDAQKTTLAKLPLKSNGFYGKGNAHHHGKRF